VNGNTEDNQEYKGTKETTIGYRPGIRWRQRCCLCRRGCVCTLGIWEGGGCLSLGFVRLLYRWKLCALLVLGLICVDIEAPSSSSNVEREREREREAFI
jgi:hypothetical protein